MAYSSTLSGFITNYDRVYPLRGGKHIYAGLYATEASAAVLIDQINEAKTNYPDTKGFVMYSYGDMAADTDAKFIALSASGAPFENPATVPSMSWKSNDVTVRIPFPHLQRSGKWIFQVSWNRPSAAGDGDYPVSYGFIVPLFLRSPGWDNL